MSKQYIQVNKAHVHNLKDITVSIPKNTLTVITGPSGSGKSSLAFDTIYIEGQRRYIESLSSYARQFLGQFQPPECESLTGLSPSIAIDQKTSSRNPRSTVGTITEIYDYLRVLFARVGTLHAPETGNKVQKYTAPQIVKEISKYPLKTKLHILAPMYFNTKEEYTAEIQRLLSSGFGRVRFDGEICPLSDETIKKYHENMIFELVVDRIVLKEKSEKRLTDSIEYALQLGQGLIKVIADDNKKGETERLYSQKFIDAETGKQYPDLEPKLFSFNSPVGACSECNGLGIISDFDEQLIVADENLPLLEGAINPLTKKNSFLYKMVANLAKQEKIDTQKPFKKLPKKFKRILFKGSQKSYTYSFASESSQFEFRKKFPGIFSWLNNKYLDTHSDKVRSELEEYMTTIECPKCLGQRLNPVALSTKIQQKNIMDIATLPINEAKKFIDQLELEGDKAIIAKKILKEVRSRLQFLLDVGLDYLTLNRGAMTLSGGESQRIRLATQIGSALSGVIYILDEPSIGLHQRDNVRLIQTMKSLRDLSNTVIVVEHDEETMRESDYIIDMGPGAGRYGGEIVAKGTLSQVQKKNKSLTAKYLKRDFIIPVPAQRRKLEKDITLQGSTKNNLENLDITFPLGGLTCLTGVSGSGKSTLIHDILVPALKSKLQKNSKYAVAKKFYKDVKGVDHLKGVIELDQSPIGRTPNSNPATYSGLFDDIRKLYARTHESQVRGYKQGRFSFNVKGGRCEECEGNGVKKIEMHFLPDVHIECSECRGKRYNKETLSVLYRGKNIADILEMSIEEATHFFAHHTRIHRILKTMNDVGLGYMKLGQPATTLSGGEAQRLKLSRELAKKTKGHTFYVLDEPTTGLHFQDIKILLEAVNQLIEQGHTVLIIEHNLDVIKTADWILDLGPEGGNRGGQLVGEGTPEKICQIHSSYTGKYLKDYLS